MPKTSASKERNRAAKVGARQPFHGQRMLCPWANSSLWHSQPFAQPDRRRRGSHSLRKPRPFSQKLGSCAESKNARADRASLLPRTLGSEMAATAACTAVSICSRLRVTFPRVCQRHAANLSGAMPNAFMCAGVSGLSCDKHACKNCRCPRLPNH